MNEISYLWTPPPVRSVAVRGQHARFPVNRIFCVGRNYHAHAIGRAGFRMTESDVRRIVYGYA